MPLISWQDIQLQYRTGIGIEVVVIRMGGASRFVRVVTHFGAFLVTVQWLDADIDVQYPRGAQSGFITGLETETANPTHRSSALSCY
jgi:hypothetical protein